MPNNTCEHCGGSQLISGLTVSASGGGGDVHPGLLCKEKEKEKGFFKWSEREKRETLFADLCTSCGTVKRLYVKDRNVIGSYNFYGFNRDRPGPVRQTRSPGYSERRSGFMLSLRVG